MLLTTDAVLSQKFTASLCNTIKEMYVGSEGMAPRKSAVLETSGAPPLSQSPDLVEGTIIRASDGNVIHICHSSIA